MILIGKMSICQFLNQVPWNPKDTSGLKVWCLEFPVYGVPLKRLRGMILSRSRSSQGRGRGLGRPCYPRGIGLRGPTSEYLSTWDLGRLNDCTGFGEVYEY